MKYPNVDFNKDIFISFLKKDLERLGFILKFHIDDYHEKDTYFFGFCAHVYNDWNEIYNLFSNTYLSALYISQGLDIIDSKDYLKKIRTKFKNKVDRFVNFKISNLSWGSYLDQLTVADKGLFTKLGNSGVKNLITANEKLEKIKEELSDLEAKWSLNQLITFIELLGTFDTYLCNSLLKLENPQEKIKKFKKMGVK